MHSTAFAHAGLAALLHRSHQLQEASQHYHEAIRLNPTFTECYSNLGHVLRDLGDLAAARNAFQHAVRLNANADDYNNLACVCKDLGGFQ
jgi:protein O-GlcNAc transferase